MFALGLVAYLALRLGVYIGTMNLHKAVTREADSWQRILEERLAAEQDLNDATRRRVIAYMAERFPDVQGRQYHANEVATALGQSLAGIRPGPPTRLGKLIGRSGH
jgi:hypothetical protein